MASFLCLTDLREEGPSNLEFVMVGWIGIYLAEEVRQVGMVLGLLPPPLYFCPREKDYG